MKLVRYAEVVARNILLKKYPLHQGCNRCGRAFLPLSLRRVPKTCDFPVDIVYTWVDGGDPEFLARKEAFQNSHVSPDANGEALYRDNQELRYSLRSVEMFAPWVRKIFLVTQGQMPSWLNPDHPKICLIDHSDIINADCLPTFNSRVIESHLHFIPGLSERYIYFNDDFFLFTPTAKHDFFTANGLPHLFLDWRESRRKGYERRNTPHACSYHNVRAYMGSMGEPVTDEVIAAHGPYPQSIRNAQEAYLFFEPILDATLRKKFRDCDEIAFNCHGASLLGYVRKNLVPCDVEYFYLNAKRSDRKLFYDMLRENVGKVPAPLFFCLNDAGADTPFIGWQRDLQKFLDDIFPDPSSFEMIAK